MPATSLTEFGDGPFLLSEGNADTGEGILSEHLLRVEYVEINERFEQQTQLGSMWVSGNNSQTQTNTFQLQHGVAYASTAHPNPPEHATLITTLSHYNGTYNNRHDTSETVFGDGAGHTFGRGEDFTPLGRTSFADGDASHGYAEWFDIGTLVIDEAAGTISAVDTNGTTHTRSLFNQDGIRRVTEFRNQSGNTAQIYVGAPITLVPSHREHTRELAYDDSFELSRSRLSEFTPLVNELAVSRGHTTTAAQTETQSDQWQEASQTWDSATWDGPDGWFDVDAQPVDTWKSTYAWKVYPQLEQVLGFSRTMLTLSENGHLSDTDGILGDTHATLGHFEDERFERHHQTTSAAHNPTGVFYHLRERYATLAYYDVFILSLSRLSETIDLSQVTSNTREHTTGFLQIPIQSAQWQLATEIWSGQETWNTEAGWVDVPGEDSTWHNRYAWQNFPQSEQVLGFSRTMLTLSENGHLSDSDGILGDTHATLGHFENERVERSHQTTQSAPHNPSGFWYHLRERFATLAYDDLFELSRSRLSEHIPLFNEQSITRAHGDESLWPVQQYETWNDTSPTWNAAGDWQTSGWSDADNEPNWYEGYSWQNFPQSEQVLSFAKAHLTVSDSNAALGSTNATLGWNTSERFDRDYFAQAIENRQSFTDRQHTRTVQSSVQLFVEPTWSDTLWAGPSAADWNESTDDWQNGSWATIDWVDSSDITWANEPMWARIARWQIASLVVETQHQTHV